MQTQRQELETLIALPTKQIAGQISQHCLRRGFRINSNADDSQLTVIAGSAEIKCKLKSETSCSTLLRIQTDYYAPFFVKLLAYGAWLIALLGIAVLHNPGVFSVCMPIFIGSVIYCEFQKVNAIKDIDEFNVFGKLNWGRVAVENGATQLEVW